MSVILNALRSQKESDAKDTDDSRIGQMVWGDCGKAHLKHPPTRRDLLILLSSFFAVLVISLGLWIYKGSAFGDKKAQDYVAQNKAIVAKLRALSVPLIPGIPLDLLEKAHTYFEEGRFDESLKLYKKAVSLKPDNALLHNSI